MSDTLNAFNASDEAGDEPFPGDPRVAESRLRARLAAEIEQGRALQQRLAALGERYPSHYARLNILLTLSRLQDARGGEFPPQMVFVHMPDVILNVRRIGKLDPDALTAGVEVHENGDIKPGIVWIPIDQIMWAGTTNQPYGRERVALEQSKDASELPVNEQYEQIRRALAGLESSTSTEEDEPEEDAKKDTAEE
jgi:hypothetical protein